MRFEATETQQLIRKTARDFATKALEPGAAERERNGQFPTDLLKQMADLGLMGVNWKRASEPGSPVPVRDGRGSGRDRPAPGKPRGCLGDRPDDVRRGRFDAS